MGAKPILDLSGVARTFPCLQGPQSGRVRIDGREVILFSSNNYLGLANHPAVLAAAKKAIDEYGLGTAASRSLAGNTPEHEALEAEIAAFKSTEAALLFNSGYAGNVGTITSLMGPKDIVFSDAENHASIVDGCRLSAAHTVTYPHLDMDTLAKGLQQADGYRQRLIVTDAVFSMQGSIAPLEELVALAERHDALVMVDEAHATGVLGDHGTGAVAMAGLGSRVAIVLGTLGKALGSVGGYVTGSHDLIEHLRRRARTLLFSTSLPAVCAAASRAALKLLQTSPELLQRLWENTLFFEGQLRDLGFDTMGTRTPIVPILIGDPDKARELTRSLLAAGVHTQALTHPYVPRGAERLRTLVTAAHTQGDLEEAVKTFRKVGQELRLI
jgi:glycine C-acetyltransferase